MSQPNSETVLVHIIPTTVDTGLQNNRIQDFEEGGGYYSQ
jgi:hypothetical protein